MSIVGFSVGLMAKLVHDGDWAAATASLGVAPKTFEDRLSPARKAALALWHDQKTPPRSWRQD